MIVISYAFVFSTSLLVWQSIGTVVVYSSCSIPFAGNIRTLIYFSLFVALLANPNKVLICFSLLYNWRHPSFFKLVLKNKFYFLKLACVSTVFYKKKYIFLLKNYLVYCDSSINYLVRVGNITPISNLE